MAVPEKSVTERLTPSVPHSSMEGTMPKAICIVMMHAVPSVEVAASQTSLWIF